MDPPRRIKDCYAAYNVVWAVSDWAEPGRPGHWENNVVALVGAGVVPALWEVYLAADTLTRRRKRAVDDEMFRRQVLRCLFMLAAPCLEDDEPVGGLEK